MEKISVEQWNKDRASVKENLKRLQFDIEENVNNPFFDQHEQYALTESGLNIFSILERFDKRTESLRLDYFRSKQES